MKASRRTVVKVGEAFPGKLPDEKGNDTDDCNAARDRETNNRTSRETL